MGFTVLATGGTAQAIRRMGVPVERINKVFEGSPNVVDRIEAGEVDLVVTRPPAPARAPTGYEIRRAAVGRGIPCITTMSGASAAQRAIRALRTEEPEVISLQELHGGALGRFGQRAGAQAVERPGEHAAGVPSRARWPRPSGARPRSRRSSGSARTR